jgi:hypothetical protein
MAQVGGWIEKSGGVMLPAPKVQLYQSAAPVDVFVSGGYPSANVRQQIQPVRRVKVTVPGIPASILDDVATYQPMVELMRYTRLNGRENVASGNGFKSGGYVHPSHGPAASGDGSFTHGGAHGGVGPDVQAIRPTEWPILAGNDAIDVTQGMLGFMCIVDLTYRDNTGNYNVFSGLAPSTALSRRQGRPGRRFPYVRQFSPGYFEFRLSVIDPSDPRGKRIHGPVSSRVACTTNIFPFLPAGLDVDGNAQATIDARYEPRIINFWIGAASRLPAQ